MMSTHTHMHSNMILDLYPEEPSDWAVKALEVNITVFILLQSLMAETQGTAESGHRGHAGFLPPARLSVFMLHTNQTPSSII